LISGAETIAAKTMKKRTTPAPTITQVARWRLIFKVSPPTAPKKFGESRRVDAAPFSLRGSARAAVLNSDLR
jgi:hypothetical protein